MITWWQTRERSLAQNGNGIDLVAVYELLRGMSGRMDQMSGRVDQMSGRLDQVYQRLDQVYQRLDVHERKLDELTVGLADLRAAVTNYHSAVLGHGILISELDERVPRIERHLKFEPSPE